ncbi:MAG: hypothetical protein V3T28_11005 [Gemmatimonadales bacterium]
MIRRSLFLAAGVAVVAAQMASAQSYRTLVESRNVTDETTLRVNIEFVIGEFLLGPARNDVLYRMALVYDEDRFEPDVSFHDGRDRLDIGFSWTHGTGLHDTDKLHQRLDLALSPDVPLDLRITFGAAAGDIELGGLSLTEAVIKTGASQSTIRFSEPNRITCERLVFQVGAAQFEALQLGNSRCRSIELNGAVGKMLLDFTGEWSDAVTTHAQIKMGLGKLLLRLPESLGVRLDVDRFLVGLDRSGFLERGGAYYSTSYDTAARKLTIEIQAALGTIEIDWVRG